jgi:hypothetical protein
LAEEAKLGACTAAALAKPRSMSGVLNLEQYLELLLGPKGSSAFHSDSARRNAWRGHRAELLPLVDPGSRPFGWWQYEATEPVLPRESVVAYLERSGQLTEPERIRLQCAGIYVVPQATRNP